ncbi:TPA: TraY domain-containing protein [Citrobacter freundii]
MKEPKSNIRKLINIGGLIGKKVNISCSLDEAIDELLMESALRSGRTKKREAELRGNDSNLLIVFYVQIMPDDLVMQLHRF